MLSNPKESDCHVDLSMHLTLEKCGLQIFLFVSTGLSFREITLYKLI